MKHGKGEEAGFFQIISESLNREMKLTTIDLLKDTKVFKHSTELETKLECKFVILSSPIEHFLIYGPLHQYNYHAQLVEKLCFEQKIDAGWQKLPDIFKINDKTVQIKGGGWLQFDFFHKKLTAMSLSTAYGRFDESIFELFIESNQFPKDFTVHIKE